MKKITAIILFIILMAGHSLAADQRIQYNERMVGAGSPLYPDTLNRLSQIEHNTDGTHKYLGSSSVLVLKTGDSLSAAITSAGSTTMTFRVVGTITTAATTTIPANISLEIEAPGNITKVAGSLHILGPFAYGQHQMFINFSPGDVVFGDSTGVIPNPYWWGAIADDTTDSYSAIQSAIDSVSSDVTGTIYYAGGAHSRGMNAAKVSLPSGKYRSSGTISTPTGVFFDGNNSVITAMTASIDMFKFRYTTNSDYYGTFMGGLANITLDGANLADACLRLERVNWSDFRNITATRCTTAMILEEVQYSNFSQINLGNSYDNLVITYHPDQPLLVSTDNSFYRMNITRAARYGTVIHAGRNNSFFGLDSGRNGVADVVVGGEYWGTPAGYSLTKNHFYSLKIEHNRDDWPTSGYAIILDGPADTVFDNLAVERLPGGTAHDPYFKWIYNDAYNTVLNNPYSYTQATGSGMWENPDIPGDYSIFRAINSQGLLVNYGAHWDPAYIAGAAVDADDLPVAGTSKYTYTYSSAGGFAAHSFYAYGAADGAKVFSSKTTSDTKDKIRIRADGSIDFGNGTDEPDVTLLRPEADGGLTVTGSGILRADVHMKSPLFRGETFTPSAKNLAMSIQSSNFEVSGVMLYALTSNITNTTGNSYGLYLNPTYNQVGAGSGTNNIVTIAPTYTSTSSGRQFPFTITETGATYPAFRVDRQGFISSVTGTSVASATTIAPTGLVTPVTGTTSIATISLPYTGFSGTIELAAIDGTFSTTTAGNIVSVATVTIGTKKSFSYIPAASKWYPN